MKVIFGSDSIKFPLTGLGRYSLELASCLKEREEISELFFLHGHHLIRQIPMVREKISVVQSLRYLAQKSYFFSAFYRLIVPRLKTYILKQHPEAIYHSPNFYLPPNVDRCLATFHDLSVFTWPQCHRPERVYFMQKELCLTIKRAAILIADSDFARLELAEYFNLPLSKVYVAKLASSGIFYPRATEDLSRFLSLLGLQVNQYCLFVGSIEPRKNIETLLNAYERLPMALRMSVPLVISGCAGWSSAALHQRFEHLKNSGWFYYLGYVKCAVLPYLFAGARSFLFPSLYEGFGLPILEAMASGVPVVCSDSGSLPEVAGSCALMCSAKDVDTLTVLIKRSIEDNTWRKRAKINGLNRAKQFSWKRCAQETLLAYQQV
ncbi:glycosyltransferase family 4 protein [Candidatus Gillettellia adelgis]